jgi:predicted  nucleic acid-binding Zn-ribbon protein
MLTSTPTSIASRRGAARVGAPAIVMFVLLLVALFYAYVAQDAEALARRELDAARADRAESRASVETITRDLADRSLLLGFSENPAINPSNVESAAAALAELKANFPNMEPVSTFEDAVPSAISSYQTKVAQIRALQTRISELEGQVSAERDAKSALQAEKDQRISTLEQEARDAAETADSEISRLEDSVSKLRSQLNSTTEQVTDAEDAKRATERALETAKLEHAAARGQWTSQRNDIKRRSEKADGEISAVMSEFGVGFINLSASDRLSEGTVFRIVSGRPGADTSKAKAHCRVTNVGPKFAEVAIYDVADRFEPVVVGDQIYNPLYEAKGQRNAVLAGNISGAYNEAELRTLFAEIGIEIQSEISNATDFLITGGPIRTDEDGEPLEEPMPVDQLPVYGEARDLGITIVSMRDLLQYFER